MNPDILLKVLGYAVVPLVMAWIGNHLASKVIEDKRRRNMYRGAFFILVFLGIAFTWLVEWRSDISHAVEIKESREALGKLQSTLTANQIENASALGYLKGKLDQPRQPADFSALGDAIARSNAQLIANEQKRISDKDLSAHAIDFAKRMRAFETAMKSAEDAQIYPPANLSSAQLQDFYKNRGAAMAAFYERATEQFRSQFLGEAVNLRNQMEQRLKDKGQPLPPHEAYKMIAFDCALAGPSPISDAADYLEALARRLTQPK